VNTLDGISWYPPSIVAGDFNGEAMPDISVETGSSCSGSACGQSTMNIFIDNGGTVAVSLTGEFQFYDFVRGDFATRAEAGPSQSVPKTQRLRRTLSY
jgi:hypothetical protein